MQSLTNKSTKLTSHSYKLVITTLRHFTDSRSMSTVVVITGFEVMVNVILGVHPTALSINTLKIVLGSSTLKIQLKDRLS